MQAVTTMVAAGTGVAVVSENVTRLLGRGLVHRLLAGRSAGAPAQLCLASRRGI